MTKKITKAQALAALEEVVSGHEDYVYEAPKDSIEFGSCAYSTPDGKPSCIVGHVYLKLNPDLFREIHKKEWDITVGEDDIDGFYVGNGPDEGYVTEGARKVLQKAQTAQDGGMCWSRALEAAKGA